MLISLSALAQPVKMRFRRAALPKPVSCFLAAVGALPHPCFQ